MRRMIAAWAMLWCLSLPTSAHALSSLDVLLESDTRDYGLLGATLTHQGAHGLGAYGMLAALVGDVDGLAGALGASWRPTAHVELRLGGLAVWQPATSERAEPRDSRGRLEVSSWWDTAAWLRTTARGMLELRHTELGTRLRLRPMLMGTFVPKHNWGPYLSVEPFVRVDQPQIPLTLFGAGWRATLDEHHSLQAGYIYGFVPEGADLGIVQIFVHRRW